MAAPALPWRRPVLPGVHPSARWPSADFRLAGARGGRSRFPLRPDFGAGVLPARPVVLIVMPLNGHSSTSPLYSISPEKTPFSSSVSLKSSPMIVAALV